MTLDIPYVKCEACCKDLSVNDSPCLTFVNLFVSADVNVIDKTLIIDQVSICDVGCLRRYIKMKVKESDLSIHDQNKILTEIFFERPVNEPTNKESRSGEKL